MKDTKNIIAALDVGSSKTACLIARAGKTLEDSEIIGVGHQASQGIKNGAVVDLNAAENVIRQVVHAAEDMAADSLKGYPLRDVIINVPDVHAVSNKARVDVRIDGHEITDNDVRRALAKAQDQCADAEYEMIHTIPVVTRLDGQDGVDEPRGMVAQKMEVDIHMVQAEAGALRNIMNCVERSHLDAAGLCLSSYAAGLSCLVEDERELGCTVVDIGGGTTSIGVFQGDCLIHASAVGIGGQHLTSDIAKGLTTSTADAERIKTLYGSAMAASGAEAEMIDVPPIGEEDYTGGNMVPRSLLIGIMQPRLEEILEMVRAELEHSGLAKEAIARRVVLTGGTSQIPAIRDLGGRVLDKQVRAGKPKRMHGLPDTMSAAPFAGTVGLLHYYLTRSHEMPHEVMAALDHGSLIARFKHWMRENW